MHQWNEQQHANHQHCDVKPNSSLSCEAHKTRTTYLSQCSETPFIFCSDAADPRAPQRALPLVDVVWQRTRWIRLRTSSPDWRRARGFQSFWVQPSWRLLFSTLRPTSLMISTVKATASACALRESVATRTTILRRNESVRPLARRANVGTE